MNSDTILSTKHAILSSGGSRYNDNYYNYLNSSTSMLETTYGWQNIISLPSLQFGSSSQINVPIDQFVGNVVLHLRLPNLVTNQSLTKGWGVAMLQSISFSFGNSSSTQIVLQNDAIFQTIMAQCDSVEKRDVLFTLMGQAFLEPQVAPAGEDVPLIDAYIPIPLPFSSVCGDKLPFDTTMLQSNITVNIQFNQNPSTIYGGSATPYPSAFTVAEVLLRQGKLSNQAASVRQLMISKPDLIYPYPWIYSQYFQSSTFAGVRESDQYQGCSVELNAFPNADLVGIAFYVVSTTNKSPTGGNSPNPFNSDDISNVLVTFNGSTLFNLPGKSYRLTNILSGPDQDGTHYPNTIIDPGTTSKFTVTAKDNYMIYLDFSRERSACLGSHLFNVFRLPNQILRVQFNTTLGNTTTYRLYATYFMNAVIEVSNGSSLVRID